MKTLIALLGLTLLTGWVATEHLPIAISFIAVIKLLLVAFNFMELKHAHIFWKATIILFSLSFLTALTLLTP